MESVFARLSSAARPVVVSTSEKMTYILDDMWEKFRERFPRGKLHGAALDEENKLLLAVDEVVYDADVLTPQDAKRFEGPLEALLRILENQGDKEFVNDLLEHLRRDVARL
jgi:hypothetical protein